MNKIYTSKDIVKLRNDYYDSKRNITFENKGKLDYEYDFLYNNLKNEYTSKILSIKEIEVEVENVIKSKYSIMDKGFVQIENNKQVEFKMNNSDLEYYLVTYRSLYSKTFFNEEIPLIKVLSYYSKNPSFKKGQIINFKVKYISGSNNNFYKVGDFFIFIDYIDDSFKSNSNCFIVTTTMGDLNHPVVVDFRRYRDEVLLNTFFGRVFIDTYYRIGPVLSMVIKNNSFLFNILKKVILKIHKFIK